MHTHTFLWRVCRVFFVVVGDQKRNHGGRSPGCLRMATFPDIMYFIERKGRSTQCRQKQRKFIFFLFGVTVFSKKAKLIWVSVNTLNLFSTLGGAKEWSLEHQIYCLDGCTIARWVNVNLYCTVCTLLQGRFCVYRNSFSSSITKTYLCPFDHCWATWDLRQNIHK